MTINKKVFDKLKGRRIYQFYLDEETGKITDITDSMDYVKVIRCKDCKWFGYVGRAISIVDDTDKPSKMTIAVLQRGKRMTECRCEKCPYFKDIFGNYVQCVKTGRFIDYEYWHNELPDDCPLPKRAERGEE